MGAARIPSGVVCGDEYSARGQSFGGFSRFTKHCAGTCRVGTFDAKMRKTPARGEHLLLPGPQRRCVGLEGWGSRSWMQIWRGVGDPALAW